MDMVQRKALAVKEISFAGPSCLEETPSRARMSMGTILPGRFRISKRLRSHRESPEMESGSVPEREGAACEEQQ